MPDHPEPPDRPPAATPREPVQRWRLVLERAPVGGDAGQREQLAAWEAALASSGLPAVGMDAVPARARFTPAAPLAASIPGEAELADIWLTERLPAWRVREALAPVVPPGFRLVDVYDVWLGAPALPGQVTASVYRAELEPGIGPDPLRGAADGLLAASTLPRVRQKGTSSVSYDLRPFLDGLEVSGGEEPEGRQGVTLRMTLRHDPEKGIGRPEEVLLALGERLGRPLEPRSLVRERLVLAPPPRPPAHQPARPRPRQAGSPTSRPRK